MPISLPCIHLARNYKQLTGEKNLIKKTEKKKALAKISPHKLKI
jgi:hypothetical protein